MKKHKKLIAIILVAILAVGAACYTVLGRESGEEVQYIYKEETVEFGNLMQGITESGSVEFLTDSQDYSLSLQAEEEEEEEDDDDDEEDAEKYLRIDEVMIAAGQRIEEGDAVFSLTEKSIADIRKKLQSEQAEAQITLAEAKADYETGALTAKHTYDSSVLEGSSAEAEYQIASATLQEQITQAAGKISILQREVEELQEKQEDEDDWQACEDLKDAYEEAKKAFEKIDESRLPKYIERRDAYLAAKEKYEKAKEERDNIAVQMEDKNEEIAKQYAELVKLQQKLERSSLTTKQEYEDSSLTGSIAQEIYQYSTESLQDAVSTAETELAEAEERLEEFEAFVGDGILYAQGSGLVTEVNYEAGDYLEQTGKMFSYVGEGNYVISVDISEEDVPSISVGDAVNIVFTAYPDENYEGKVSEITTSISDAHASTVSYPVTVQILGDTEKLFGGMSADVTFVTEEADEVLYVSRKAVVEQNGKQYVYTAGSDGSKKLMKVETGFTDGVSIQIVSGLSQGDTVYIESKISTEGEEGTDHENNGTN